MRTLIVSVVFLASAAASVPIRDGCTEDSAVVADVQDSVPIQVHHGVIGEALPCYAVSVTQAGQEVRGFILGSSLPAIQEFERTRALESRLAMPAPPPAPAKLNEKKIGPAPPNGPLFESWSGVDVDGSRVQIKPGDRKITLVTFWAGGSPSAERLAQNVMQTESDFRAKGVQAFGVTEAASSARAKYYLDDMGLDYPQSLDGDGLAAKYHVDPTKGATIIIDSSNHILAISSNPAEIRDTVAKLLSPE